MLRIIKQHILRLIERAGYVVTKTADQERREQFIADLQAELTQRGERVAELEQARRKFVEADRDFRLGRERDARALEAARAETWQLKGLAAELQRELDALREQRTDPIDLSKYDPPTAVRERVDEAP